MAKTTKKEDANEELKLTEAEAILGVHHMTMMKYIWDERIAAYKNIKGHYRIKRGDLLKFKEQLEAAGGNKSGKKWESEANIRRNVRISLELAKKIAIISIEHGKSIDDIVSNAIETYLVAMGTAIQKKKNRK